MRARSGNNYTIGFLKATEVVRGYGKNGIDDNCLKNLELLVEIRDNAIHFHNKGLALQKQVQEIGSGSLRNFAQATSTWFGFSLSKYNFSIMPVAFETPEGLIKTAFADTEKGAAKRLLKLLADEQAASPFDPNKPFNVGVKIELRFVRTAAPEAIVVRPGPPEPGAIPLFVTEEDALAPYAWRYDDLTKALKKRYSDFKQNDKFNQLMKAIEKDEKYCKERRLDPKNPKSSRQKFYSPNVTQEFDKQYARK